MNKSMMYIFEQSDSYFTNDARSISTWSKSERNCFQKGDIKTFYQQEKVEIQENFHKGKKFSSKIW